MVRRRIPLRHRRRLWAFTIVELLVVVAVLSLLAALLLPSLAGARDRARGLRCLSNLRQLGLAQTMYAGDHGGRVLPAAYTNVRIIGSGPPVYWWGALESEFVDHERGFVWPYLQSDLRDSGVFECPNQPWGSYVPQGVEGSVTSTYGYNGYYLSPPQTPGWSSQIRGRPWQSLERIPFTSMVISFGDAMLAWDGERITNSLLLDPPRLFTGSHRWVENEHPTQSFRHAGRTACVFVDGHAAQVAARSGAHVSGQGIGSVSAENNPHYIPDWQEW